MGLCASPLQVIAACTEEHRSAALLVIPFDDFLAAAKRRSEQALLRRIEFCCCMPVLRHTPFKELHLLCSYMTEANYEPGAFITCQGKEATHVHIVLEGEVRMPAPTAASQLGCKLHITSRL